MIKLDKKDLEILRLLQKNSKLRARVIARKINSPITTVFDKIKRMEKSGIIKEYKTVLDAKKLDKGTTAFILASFEYRPSGLEKPLSQLEVVKQIANFPEVQEIFIIAGDWDILIKVKEKNVDTIGDFITKKLRTVKGIEKTLSLFTFNTLKETSDIFI